MFDAGEKVISIDFRPTHTVEELVRELAETDEHEMTLVVGPVGEEVASGLVRSAREKIPIDLPFRYEGELRYYFRGVVTEIRFVDGETRLKILGKLREARCRDRNRNETE